MNKPLEKHNCTGRYRVIAMALVLAMVITYMLPAGTYRTFGENADTASGDGLMGPNSASGSVFEEGSAASAAGTSAPALNGGAETPSAPASNKGDDGEGSDIGRFDVPDFGNVFGATADDNLKLAPIPDIRAGSASEGGLEKAPAETEIQSLGETVVNDWAGLRTAIADASVSKIIFGGDITRSDANYLGYINRDLEIDGAGFILNNKQNGSTNTNQSVFFLGAGKTATLKLCNMEVIDGASGGDNGQSFIGTQYNTSNTTTFYSSNREAAHGNNSQHWNIEIENVWQSQPDPENPVMFPGTVTCGMVAACDATVTFSGRVSWSANSNTRVVNARDLTFAEDSVTDFAALGGPDYIAVDGYPTIWIYASTPSRDDTLTVKDGAHLTVYSQNSQAIILGDGAEGTITTRSNATYPYAEVTISGEDTLLYCYSDAHYGTGNGTTTYECPGVVNLKGGGSVKAPAGGATNSVAVTISDGARMKIESRYNTSGCAGLCVQIPSAITLVTGRGSKLSSSVNSSSCYAGPLWFRYVGNQELKVIDGGRLEANFWEHPTNSTAALRFGPASGNAFTCRSGGSVHIYNAGNGTANNGTGADATGNMAIEYAQNGFIFDIDGEKSSVELVADWGPAINAKNFTDGVINCNNGAIFSARGCTADSTEGIFRAGSNLKMNVNNPLYFDFTNTKSGGGQIFAINSNSASNNPSFSLTNSNLSIWRKGHESWNGTPWKSWIMATLALSGSNFTTATTSNPPDMGPCFTGSFSATPPDNNMRNYTRLSSNNAPAHITDVLPATNADKYIRAIAMVPEGFSQTLRGAYDNEVSAIFKITPASGSAPYQVTASSTESERVYGENMKGVVRYELPAPYYLATGDEIEVVDAWIGPANAKNPGSGVRYIQSPAEDITTEAVTVEDKSPPLPGAITTQTFYANQKKVEGTWSLDESYNADPPVKIVAYQNGSLIKEAGVPVYGLVSGSGNSGTWSFTFPSSCNIQAGDLMQFALEDAAGNRVYLASTAYHDRTFAAAPGITVQPVLYDISCDDVYVGTAQAIGLEPSSPGAFIDMNSAKGYDLSKPEGSRDKALSVDASSWTREWENWAGYPPFRSKAYEISYSIEGEPSFAKTAKITVVNAEKVGNRYGIGASRIDSINPEKAKSITDAELISLAGAFAFDVTDGEQAEIEVEGRDFPADGTSCGTGTVSFRAVAEPDTSTTVDVVVSRKNPPVLTVSSPAIVTMGGSFDYADNICACDAEDGDITSKVKWEGTVDTDKAGIYTLAYQVTDSDYNTAEATRIVIVQDGSFVLGDEYILQARNFAVRMDEALATDEEILGKSMAQAWEAGTGAPANDKLYVVSDGGYRDEAKTEAKDYAITVGATGDAAARCGITGKVMKKDIIGENAYYIITADNVSLPQSVAKIQLSPLSKLLGLANVQALKKSDMTQTPARLGANNVNADAIGSYTASYMVDAAPEVNAQGRVDITKGGAPTISLDPVTDMVAAGSAAEYGYMDGVSASDPEDGDITGKVAVTGSVDMDKAGVYTVTYSVEDADGNADSRVRVVAVNDGTFIATPSYILRARSFVIRAGEVEGADISSQIISRSKAQAWDAVTGAEADAMVLSAGGYGPAQGTYDIVIAAEADRSVARSLKATVVSDETAVDAGDYWIVGNPIRINSTADRAIPHPDFVALCKVRAFKADDSLTPGTPVLDSYTGSYDGTQGDFFAGFHVAEEPSNKLENLKVTVTDGQRPTLTVDPMVINLDKGAEALTYGDYMDGVSASDAEDTAAGRPLVVTYEGTVNTEVSGLYHIKYSVTDSDFNTVSLTRYYAVGAKIHLLGPYFLCAGDYWINSNGVIASPAADRDAQIIAASKAAAYDSDMEATTGAIVLVADAGGYRQLEEGEGARVFTVSLALDKAPGLTAPVKVMVGNNVVAGDRYSIAANDFSISMGEVSSITEAKLIEWAKAKAFRNSDFSEAAVKVAGNNILASPGEYSVTFKATEEPATMTTVKMHISSVPAPVISLESPVRLSVGESFDPLRGVTAEDYRHADITAKVEVTANNVNILKAGVYHADYSVKDDYGNETTARRVVAVNDGSYSVGDRYIVHAVNFVLSSRDVDIAGKEAQIKAKGEIKAWDALTGEEVTASINDDGGYRNLTDGEEQQDFTIVAGAALDAGTPEPGRAVRSITAKVVNKTVLAGENYTIAASSFTINPVDETGITDAQLIARAGGQAWKNSDFSPAQVEALSYAGSRSGVKGIFDLSLAAAAEKATKITVPVSVTEGAKPVLTVTPAALELPLKTVFDPMAGVSAADAEDDLAGIPLEITFAAIGDAVDTSAKGIYKVRYSVTDSDHNTVTADRVVAVGLIAGAKYYLDAGNFTLLLKETAGTEEEILARSGARAWDKFTGAPVSGLLRVADSGGYRQEAGEYPITIGVSGDVPVKAITGRIVEGDKIVTASGYTIVARNVSLPRSVAQASFDNAHLLSWAKVRAWRDTDNTEVPAKVKSHTVDVSATGFYHATYAAAEDITGKAEIEAKVDITDGVPPTLTVSPDPDEVALGSAPYEYMNGVTAIDDEDGDITGDIKVSGDSVDTGKAGVYKVSYTATDSDGNEARKERLVVVNNGNFYITADYALYANSYVIRKGDVAASPALREAQIIEKSAAKGWNLKTHQEMDVTVISGGGYSGAAGTYEAVVALAGDNKVRKNVRIAVIDDEKACEGENYFIVGSNIKMNPTVDRGRPDLVKAGKVRAFKNDADLTMADVSMDSYDGNFDGTQGTFNAAFSVDDEKGTKLDLEVLVSGFSLPWIKIPPSPTTLEAGADFGLMDGVTAGDDEDGDITGDIKVSGDSVDTGKAGVYKVTYAVTDSDYNTVSVDRVVVVSDGTYGVGRNFIVRANGFVLSRSEADSLRPHEQILERSGAMAWDAATGKEVAAAILDDGGYYVSDGSDVQSFKIRIGAEGDSATMPENERANVDITARVINKDYVVTGERYAIGADNFKINRTDELGVTNATLIARAKAEAWRIDGGPGSAEAEVFQYGGRRDGTAGNYGLTFDVAQEPETKVAVKVSVTDGQAPQLSVKPSLVHLEIGQGFDYMDGVSAFDAEDGDLSSGIIVSGAVDNSRQGVYPVAYTVTDSDHNRAEEVRVYVVGGGMAIGEEYIVTAGDFTASLKDMSGGDAEILTLSGARAWDKLTGAPADEVVSVIDGGGYRKAAGTYDITVGIDGDANAWRPVKATVEGDDIVISNDFPVLTVAPNPEEVAADGGAYGYMKGVSAADTEDDAALLPVTITYTGTVDTSKAGVYKVTYTATDSDGNSVQAVRVVIVNDGSIISGPGYMLRAGSFSANVMDIKGGADEILRLSGAEAWDKNGEPAVPEVKASGGYRRAGGLYSVTIGIAGRAGSPTTIIYASVSADSYTVIFDGNGADRRPIPGSLMVTQPAASVTSLPSAPARTGYSFAGWSTAKDGSGAKFEASTAVSSNMTVYAMWAANRYRLSFDLNGGKGAVPAAQTLSFGAQANAVKDPKVRKGFTFKGWNTAKDGSGAYWNFRAETMPARNVTLYAQWLKTKKIIKEVEVVVEKPRIKVEKTGGSGSMYTGRPVSPKSAGPVATPNPGNAATPSSAAVTSSAHEEPEPAAYDVAGSGSVGVDAVDTGLDMGTGENAAGKVGGWSAADLLMAIAGLLLAVFGIIAMALRRKIAGFRAGVMNITGLLVAIAAAVCNGVVFAMEDFSGPMVVAGKFTPIMAIGLAAALVGLIAALVRADSREYE